MFSGKHKPLISRTLFDEVQAVFENKNIKKTGWHFFIFRRQAICGKCRNLYIAEKQKGEVYYRCHTRGCTRGKIREEMLEDEVIKMTRKLQLNEFEYQYFKQQTLEESRNSESDFEADRKRLQLLMEQIKDRLSKLADAYVDGVFDKKTYIEKKNELLMDEQSIKEKILNQKANSEEAMKRLEAFLELVNSAYLSYQCGTPEEKREMVKTVFSNCEITGKNVLFKPYLEFQLMAERPTFTSGSPKREAARTLAQLFEKLFKYFQQLDISKNDNNFANYIFPKPEKKNASNLPD